MTRVLAIDDDPAILDVVAMILQEEEYDVVTDPGNGVAAAVARHQPDVILLDIWLRGLNGQEVARSLRQEGVATPIILMSAHSGPTEALSASGAQAFLAKPFTIDALLEAVARQVAATDV